MRKAGIDLNSEYQDYLAWTYFGAQALDKSEFARLSDLLSGVTRFIDVGASHGVYTYHANRILAGADIICIEADPERFAILEENVKKWGEGSSNRIRCVNAAASDEVERADSGEITFYTTGTQISGGLFAVAERSDAYTPRKVSLVCVDDYFEANARTFIKIDVEGAELRVLKGAQRHIDSGATRFYSEISWWGDRQRRTSSIDVLRFAWSSGFRVDRRLKSDYLFAPEPDSIARAISVLGCLPPLMIRLGWNGLVPARLRTWRERRENKRRLSRYDGQAEGDSPDRGADQASP